MSSILIGGSKNWKKMEEESEERKRMREELERLNREFKPLCMHILEDGTCCCKPAIDRYTVRCEEHSKDG